MSLARELSLIMSNASLILNPTEFFREMVDQALGKCSVNANPFVSDYLVSLLRFYMNVDNLYEKDTSIGEKTLMERLFAAHMSDFNKKKQLLKQLGDSSLYVSGFFGDSLKKKIVDIDYYAEIGGLAYGSLAAHTGKEDVAQVYDEFSKRFLKYVDVLTFISQLSFIQSQKDVLRLYDRYLSTGSDLAKQQLIDMDVLNLVDCKKSQQ